MANAELPSSHPTGNRQADRTYGGGFDPAIAAAFAAFHRRVRQPARHAYLAASARFFSGTGGAIFGLTFLAFAGGLFLAHLSFTGPEHPLTIGPSAPELIYQRPAAAENTALGERHDYAAAQAENVAAVSGHRALLTLGEGATKLTAHQPLPTEAEQVAAAGNLTPDTLPEAIANFAAAMRLNGIGGSAGSGTASDITSGFAAEELPSVPEPAAGSTIAVGLAILLGVQRFVRRMRKSL
ncbi:MAG: hypothetical protein M3Y69_05430 [Verrucomicrobiota bacterium]|nr:hypothetical protein [Verrucomicrobiota bacterium]